MRGVNADTHTWLAVRQFLFQRADDFYLQLTRARESFEPKKNSVLKNIISERRRVLFKGFLRLYKVAPLGKMGDLVRRLL